ncbi:MAG: hypothetical protein QW273_00760 [Candidatus Pacearchaeota archaeon]
MEKKKEELTPVLLFALAFIVILVLAFFFNQLEILPLKDNNITESVKEDVFSCIFKKNITLYGKSNSLYFKEQKEELGDIFKYLNFVDCSKEECIGISILPLWIVNNKTYYGALSKEILIKIAGCENALQNQSR